jgi:adenylate cyclase
VTWPSAWREAILALCVAVAVMLPLSVWQPGWLRSLETTSLDVRFRLRGVQPPGPDVVVILVEDRSLAMLGRWPLSRHLFARAVDALNRAGTQLIVFDLLFAERDQPVPSALRDAARTAASALSEAQAPGLHTALAQLAADDPDGDLADAIRASGNVLLPIAFSFADAPADPSPDVSEQAYQRLDPSPVEPLFPLQPHGVSLPIAPLVEAAVGLGHVNIAYDRDGEPRYDYLALPFNGDFLPSLPVRIVAAYRGLPWTEVGLALGNGVQLGRTRIPSDPAMRLVVNYRGPRGTIPIYSFVDLLQDRLTPDLFRGRIVLLGASFLGMTDTHAVPFGPTPMSGTERLAHIVDTILQGDFIRENPPPWPALVIGAVAVLALLTGTATALLPTRLAGLAGALLLCGWCIGAQVAFGHGLWLPLVTPVVALAVATLSVLLFRYGIVDQQRRRIQVAFRHYLAPELVQALAAHPDRLQLGGETRMLSVMFCDIRGFTAISEQFQANPQGLSRLINRGFLSPMTAIIMSHRGTIDKYIGDCIMAFWNAPLDDPAHADRACASALAMVAALDRINDELAAEAYSDQRPFVPLHIGIGINSGTCVVGNMGSEERFAYTAMGDAVNLAARLEGQTKYYHVAIIIGEATRQAAPTWAALELDVIAVQGKQEAVRIYALLGDERLACSPAFAAYARRHEGMLACYRQQDWAAAAAALATCRGGMAALAAFYDLYEQRIAFYRDNPPGPGWDGIFVAETK